MQVSQLPHQPPHRVRQLPQRRIAAIPGQTQLHGPQRRIEKRLPFRQVLHRPAAPAGAAPPGILPRCVLDIVAALLALVFALLLALLFAPLLALLLVLLAAILAPPPPPPSVRAERSTASDRTRTVSSVSASQNLSRTRRRSSSSSASSSRSSSPPLSRTISPPPPSLAAPSTAELHRASSHAYSSTYSSPGIQPPALTALRFTTCAEAPDPRLDVRLIERLAEAETRGALHPLAQITARAGSGCSRAAPASVCAGQLQLAAAQKPPQASPPLQLRSK